MNRKDRRRQAAQASKPVTRQVANTVASAQNRKRIRPQARASHSDDRAALHQAGLDLIGQRRWGEAEAIFRKIRAADPESKSAPYFLALTLKGQGNSEEAITAFHEAIAIDPEYAQAHAGLGVTLWALGRLAEAEASCRRALHLDPDLAEAHNSLGSVQWDQDRLEAAEASYRRAIELDPEYARGFYNLGSVLRLRGELQDARVNLRRALELNPNHADAHTNIGNIEWTEGRLKEAEAWFRRALELKPDDAVGFYNLGSVLRLRGKLQDARVNLRRALGLNPTYADAHTNLANLEWTEGRPEAAEACFRRAVELSPNSSDAHFRLGSLLRKRRNLEEAAKYYEQTLKLDPTNNYARHFLAVVRGKKLERASEHYVAQVFDGYSENFDKHLVKGLRYKVPEKIGAAVANLPSHEQAAYRVLDLGCGTGLCGAAIHEFAAYLAGVDLSPKMVAKAHARGIYDDLWVEDIDSALARFEGNLDLIVAGDVFVYLGELQKVFSVCSTALRANGWLLFTTEDTEAKDFELTNSGRFAHNPDHVALLANSCGFVTESCNAEILRLENEKPVQGRLFVLRRQ